jgi:enoyl-CoA hydratase/carnithine racemase
MKLVNRVLPRAELLVAAEALAHRLKDCNPRAVSCAKQAVTRGLDMSLAEGLDLERRLGKPLI